MNLLVLEAGKISGTDYSIPDWSRAIELGHKVNTAWVTDGSDDGPDAVICMSVSVMEQAWNALRMYPNVPLFVYHWDLYKSIVEHPRPGEYDYLRWGSLLDKANEVWVPSDCTGRRANEWWNTTNWHTIRSAVQTWEAPDTEDYGFALCCLREIPDPHFGLFEQACDDLEMPCRMTRHAMGREEYEHTVAHCSFIVAPLYELSTGGLSLLEAYYLGKPALISDSEWNGAVDYLGDRAAYFESGNLEDLKISLQLMWAARHEPVADDHKEYVTETFSDARMVEQMIDRIEASI